MPPLGKWWPLSMKIGKLGGRLASTDSFGLLVGRAKPPSKRRRHTPGFPARRFRNDRPARVMQPVTQKAWHLEKPGSRPEFCRCFRDEQLALPALLRR